jgi:TolB-like protein/DNA-binding SARP family transcriptional activator/cytochrome c-type biogenesis protein CcmH/NrfG
MGLIGSVRLKLLGGFSASLASGRAVELAGKKNRALLAYLALGRGKRHGREKLMALLWSDRGEAQARGSLRQALSALKEALAEGAPGALVVEGDSVGVEPEAVATDVAELEAFAGSGSAADLRRAAELYEGDLLDGLGVHDPSFEDWLAAERARLREVTIGVLGRLTAGLVGAEAVAVCQRLVALDPLREGSHRALMLAYAGAGERALALQHYAQCRDLLKAELGVAPARETEELRRRLLREEETSPAPAEGAAPKDQPRPGRQTPEVPHALTLPDKPSIAVLPFDNMSGDPEHAYFADGLAEDLITDLSKVPSLFVIARYSSFAYKGRSTDIRQVARELGVKYVLEGSARRAGGHVRINVQLIDAAAGGHVWAERFDRDLSDIFAVQDEVIGKIVEALVGRLTATQTPERRRPANMEAYDLCVRGRALFSHFQSPQDTREQRLLLERAIALEPEFAEAHRLLAISYSAAWLFGGEPKEPNLRLGIAEAQKALALDPDDAEARWINARLLTVQGRLNEAEAEFAVALELDPNQADAWAMLSDLVTYGGRITEALADIQEALRLNPHPPGWYYWLLGQAQYLDRQYDKAVQTLRREETYRSPSRRILAASLAQLERLGDARREGAMFMASNQHFTIRNWAESQPFGDEATREHFVDGYRKAGLPE